MSSLYSSNMQDFLSQTFMPGVFHQVEGRESVYLDDCSASGCLIRGPVATLVDLGIHMRRQMWEWYQDMVDKGQEGNIPAVPMCIALIGDWQFSKYKHANLGEYAFVFSLALAQASSGISRDCGMGRLIAYKDNKEGLRPFGGVRVETLDTGVGQRVQVLYNNGLAITAAALAELTGELRAKAEIHEYRVDKNEAKSVLSGFRMPAGELDLVAIQLRSSHDEPPILIARVGQPCLAGVDVDLFEVLDPVSDEAALIVNKGLPLWASHRG